MEVWKDIDGFEGLYQVSNYGNVRNRKKILSPATRKDGRKQVILNKNGMHYTRKVHRLVAIAFLSNPHNYKEINHKDENPNTKATDDNNKSNFFISVLCAVCCENKHIERKGYKNERIQT